MAIDRHDDEPPLRREDARPSPKATADLRATPFTEDVFDDEYYGRRRRAGGLSFGLIALVIFGAAAAAVAGWYAFGSRATGPVATGPGGVPLVKADPTPYKIKPDNPGGMQVADQDKLIYERVEKGTPPHEVENLLPAPAEPKAPPIKAEPKTEVAQNQPPAAQAQAPVSANAGSGTTNAPQGGAAKMTPISPLAAAPAAAPPPSAVPALASPPPIATSAPATLPPPTTAGQQKPATAPTPDKIAEVPDTSAHTAADPLAKMVAQATGGHVASNGDVVAAATPPTSPSPPVGAPAPTGGPLPLIPSGGPLPLIPSGGAPAAPPLAIASAPPPVTTPVTPVPAPGSAPLPTIASAAPGAPTIAGSAEPPPPAGGVYVQLASAQSEEGAFGEWKRISGHNKDLLGSLSPAVSRADLADKGTFYRLRAGPLPDKTAAQNLCAELTARNVGCILVRPQ